MKKNMKIDKSLSEVFDLDDDEDIIEGEVLSVIEYDNKETSIQTQLSQKEKDFEMVRQNMFDLLDRGNDLLEDAIHIATESEQPRAFEVANGILKQLSDMNNQIMDLHNKKKEVVEEKKETTVTNNTMFVGTTADLNNIIEKLGLK